MWEIIKSTLILALITFIAAFSLSHVDNLTKPEIERQDNEKQERALGQVLPGYSVDAKEKKSVEIDGKEFVFWIGKKMGKGATRFGFAYITEKPGYSGTVRSMVGVTSRGKILGISILQQTETPGLGARAIEVASKLTFLQWLLGEGIEEEAIPPWFQMQFAGINAGNKLNIVKKGDWNESMKQELLKDNAVSAITGATITTKAVSDSIAEGYRKFKIAIKK